MNKEFDFDDIGKKTPYRTPDNFFEDMQQKVMERTWRRQRRKHRLQIMFSTAIAAAAILAGVLFGSVLSPDGRYTCRNFGYVGYRKK